jgi:hypothetical protein
MADPGGAVPLLSAWISRALASEAAMPSLASTPESFMMAGGIPRRGQSKKGVVVVLGVGAWKCRR